MATLLKINKPTDDQTECRMVYEVVGGGYYQPNHERFNRVYSSNGVSPTITARCDRFSIFWICEEEE